MSFGGRLATRADRLAARWKDLSHGHAGQPARRGKWVFDDMTLLSPAQSRGRRGGRVTDETTQFPQEYRIDYIRVYGRP